MGPGVIDKKNESISFRVADEIKTRFQALCDAEGKHASTVLTGLIEGYISEREEYIASIAPMFGYEKPDDKKKGA